MAASKTSRTETNLEDAFIAETLASRRYMEFAARADAEGHGDVAALFRMIAYRRGSLARRHLEVLERPDGSSEY